MYLHSLRLYLPNAFKLLSVHFPLCFRPIHFITYCIFISDVFSVCSYHRSFLSFAFPSLCVSFHLLSCIIALPVLCFSYTLLFISFAFHISCISFTLLFRYVAGSSIWFSLSFSFLTVAFPLHCFQVL